MARLAKHVQGTLLGAAVSPPDLFEGEAHLAQKVHFGLTLGQTGSDEDILGFSVGQVAIPTLGS